MYKAIVEFYDLTDGNRKYRVGETFPRPDLKVSDERIAFLSGNGNKLGRPVIEKVGKAEKVEETSEATSEETAEITKETIEKMPYFGLKALASKNGIDTDGKKTAELRTEIIEKLNL